MVVEEALLIINAFEAIIPFEFKFTFEFGIILLDDTPCPMLFDMFCTWRVIGLSEFCNGPENCRCLMVAVGCCCCEAA